LRGVPPLAIEHIHTYLVHPTKGSEIEPELGGASVPLNGKLFRLLDDIYSRSDTECDIDISFNQGADGSQQNECRDLFVSYLQGPTLARGRLIAERLSKSTDQRSGLGLLFIISGKEGRAHKIVVSRFPTDSAILAEENQRTLTVEFLERVFMKSRNSYKAVVYEDSSLHAGFWLGRAIDRQINSAMTQVSNYWIFDFLDSDFQVTPAAGTRRLGAVLRSAAKKSEDINVKTEIAAAVTLAGTLKGKKTSIREFMERFGLSEAATEAIRSELKAPNLAEERFQFDLDEFKNQVGYRSVELDNGGMLTAQTAEFDKVFHREILDDKKQEVQFTTRGKVVSEKLRKSQ
jgi:hypothetical protein